MKQLLKFFSCLLFPLAIGGLSGFLTSTNINNWYVYLNKPSFNPPNNLFGPVWTILYLLMGLSVYILLIKDQLKPVLMAVFLIQLTLNFLWSIIFFKFHWLGFALIEIILLWISIFSMIYLFYKANKWAAFINIPYLLWVSFASLLTFQIYILN